MKHTLHFFLLFASIFSASIDSWGQVDRDALYVGIGPPVFMDSSYIYFPPIGSLPANVLSKPLLGNYEVNGSGGLQYVIPLSMPLGTGGLSPALSIVYESQGVDGVLGMGWRLSGISSIQRVGQSLLLDGRKGGVNLDGEDRFMLDGKRLLLGEGESVYGGNGTSYDLEIRDFSDIFSYVQGETAQGPSCFKVQSKEGLLHSYGWTSDSRQAFRDEAGMERVGSWYINKTQDLQGNYMEYRYYMRDHFPRIREIRYTGNASLSMAPYNRIVFGYISRTHPRIYYLGGERIEERDLLSHIEIYSDGALVRMYVFTYENAILSHIAEVDGSGEMLSNLSLGWSDEHGEFSPIQQWTSDYGSDVWGHAGGGSKWPRFVGDVNGDGLADIVGCGENAVSARLSNGTNAFDGSFSNGLTCFTASMGWTQDNERVLADMNGDGRADLMGYGHGGLAVSLSKGDYFAFENRWVDDFNWGKSYPRFLGDHNGDGLADIYGFYTWFTHVARGLGNGLGAWYEHDDFTEGQNFTMENSERFVQDVNGDGLSDLICVGLRDTWIPFKKIYYLDNISLRLANEDGFTPEVIYRDFTDKMYSRYPVSEQVHPSMIYFRDMNGDGLSDMVFRCGSEITVSSFTGREFLPLELWTASCRTGDDDSVYSHFVEDADGDGRLDVLAFDGDGNLHVSLNLGDYLAAPQVWLIDDSPLSAEPWDQIKYRREFADVNGDGMADVVIFWKNGVYVSLNMSSPKKLIWVKDGFTGQQTDFSYTTLSKMNAPYTPSTAKLSYPLSHFRGALWVVKEIATTDGLKGRAKIGYAYQGAKLHLGGRGFLGFERISSHSTVNGLLTHTDYTYDTLSYIPLVTHTEIRLQATEALLSTTDHVYQITPHERGGSTVKRMSTRTEDKLKGISTQETSSYDAFSNLTKNTIQTGEAIDEYRYGYTAVGTNKPNRVSSERHKSYFENSTLSITRTEQYSYDATGNLLQTINDAGTAIACTTDYTYYPHTNAPKKEVFSGSDFSPRIKYYDSYDPHYRFLLSYHTDLEQMRYIYDLSLGHLLSSTDEIRGHTTSYVYDRFGRQTRVNFPTGEVITYVWGKSPLANAPAGTAYHCKESGTNRPYLITYYDTLGRELRKETVNMSGTVFVDSRYNSQDRLEGTSLPYFAGGFNTWKTYTYDAYGRLLSEKIEQAMTHYTYEGLTTTVSNAAGQSSSKTYYPHGDLAAVEDAGGLLSYTYEIPSFVKRMHAPGGAVTEIVYDSFGRQLSLEDPNAGKISYVYNSLGDIVSKRDARGYTTTYVYDAYGRLSQRLEGARISSYTYIDTGVNRGLLKSEDCNNGTSKTYRYDGFGRILELQDKIETRNDITRYTYTAQGLLASREYPSGSKILYRYDNSGQLRTIGENTGVIWQLMEINAQGQEMKSKYGRFLKTNTYNNLGMLTSTSMPGMMNLVYTYDGQTGNMTSRQDRLRARAVEYFTYDALNRLTSGSTTYAPNGNILSKESVKTYTYHPQKVHALTSVKATSPLPNERIDYTSFGKVECISLGDPGASNSSLVKFVYGADEQRRKMKCIYPDRVEDHYYSSDYEYVTGSFPAYALEYIHSPYGLIALQKNGVLAYVGTDHQGSVVGVMATSGSLMGAYSYDPWGRRRSVSNYTQYTNLPTPLIDRGYTGHEHLDRLGLINMNGRLYDPWVGRMLSPDPYVPNTEYTQDFNRYAYARNNPLMYTDPEGEWVHLLAGAILGGITNLLANINNIDNGWDALGYFGIGAVGGTFGAGIATGISSGLLGSIHQGSFSTGFIKGMKAPLSTGFSSGFVSGAAAGAVSGGFIEFGNTFMTADGDLQKASIAASKGALIGLAAGAIMGGITGGLDAHLNAGNFWTGAEDNYIVANETEKLAITQHREKIWKNEGDPKVISEKQKYSYKIGPRPKDIPETIKPNYIDRISAIEAIPDNPYMKTRLLNRKTKVEIYFENDVNTDTHVLIYGYRNRSRSYPNLGIPQTFKLAYLFHLR